MTFAASELTESPPEALLAIVAEQSMRSVSPDFSILVEALLEQYKTAADAVILYGSCLRTVEMDEGIADLYVLVDDYEKAYDKRYLGVLNAWLAPNVFYIEVPYQGRTLRAKYAVISTFWILKKVHVTGFIRISGRALRNLPDCCMHAMTRAVNVSFTRWPMRQ